uniref:Uncharacterized protein n=1 Tax=Percolomonas cosmopolitus TaxID=63605 RepID=A0A7S1PHG4_9EUKA
MFQSLTSRSSPRLVGRSIASSLTHSRHFQQKIHPQQQRHYALIFAPKHIYPKNWDNFSSLFNLKYMEKNNDKFFNYIGVKEDTLDFDLIGRQNFEGFPYYEGERDKYSDDMAVEYFESPLGERIRNLNCENLTPLECDFMLRALFFNTSTKYMPELAKETKPFFNPITVPLWLLTNEEAGDVKGTDVRFFKDRHDHVRPDVPQESVWAHTVHRTSFSEDDLQFLKRDQAPESIGLMTFTDLTHMAYHNMPDSFDFGRMRSIMNFGKYGINPVMPMVISVGPLIKFCVGLFSPEYCVACTKVAQHAPPHVQGTVIALGGSSDPAGWNLLIPEEREKIFRYMTALKKFATMPLSEMRTVQQVEEMIANEEFAEGECIYSFEKKEKDAEEEQSTQ